MAKITASVLRNQQGTRRRPQPPRSLISQAAALGAVITWNAPVQMKGVIGFRLYKENDTAVFEEIRDPSRRQAKIALPASTSTYCYLSTFTAQGIESPRIPVLVSSTSDQLVVSGTAGGTGGTVPPPPPGWTSEPTGGGFRFLLGRGS